MQDTEIQFVTETGKVRKEQQMSRATTSPTKIQCLSPENCTQTVCIFRHEAILFCGTSGHNSFYM